MTDPRLHLLHLSSPALPVGAYAYSQALEYAVEAGWVDDDKLREWLLDSLQLGLGQLDLPILTRVLEAAARNDIEAIDHWNDVLLANRETRELLLEDQQIGSALWRLLSNLDITLPSLGQKPGYATAFAVACHEWEVSSSDALLGYSYSWLENQVTAATKLVPLGQSAAQALLLSLLSSVPAACDEAAQLADSDIGLSLPGLALASCHHERQHTRLFRS